ASGCWGSDVGRERGGERGRKMEKMEFGVRILGLKVCVFRHISVEFKVHHKTHHFGLAMVLLRRVPELKVEAVLVFTNLELGKLEVRKLRVDKQEREENQEVEFDLTSLDNDS
nr:hypothetical protein [Tanacetum cinerariifolium]